MKKYFAALIVLFFVQQASAATFYEQLCRFNPNWKKYAAQAPAGNAREFKSDQQLIQAHLTSVLAILRSNPTSQLSKDQYRSRMQLIEVLDGYRIAGNFPMNYYREERIPVFIDEHQTHCAVGFLMQQTGHEELAQRIAAADNYVWVKDIHDAEAIEWQQASGFTMEELKLIQGAYDYYMPDAFIAPNKYEIPQKPACTVAYFEHAILGVKGSKKPENIWFRGQGLNGILNGRWEQNFSPGVPWIVGYYENGKRSGQWEEYYQGTKKLCRTECWRNNLLNGVRKRFDLAGKIIEEILFKNGMAVTKTNYDLVQGLTWVRKPIDSTLVWTEVYTSAGSLIASGHEKIYNPGNLLWFQNIELTALNSVSITARSVTQSNTPEAVSNGPFMFGGRRTNLYNSPALVEYKKEGDWTYYREYNAEYTGEEIPTSSQFMFARHYRHFGTQLSQAINQFDSKQFRIKCDSIRIGYVDNNVQNVYGYGNTYAHLQINYYETLKQNGIRIPNQSYRPYYGLEQEEERPLMIRSIGELNEKNQKIGTWKYFDLEGRVYKTETFIIPRDEDEEETAKN